MQDTHLIQKPFIFVIGGEERRGVGHGVGKRGLVPSPGLGDRGPRSGPSNHRNVVPPSLEARSVKSRCQQGQAASGGAGKELFQGPLLASGSFLACGRVLSICTLYSPCGGCAHSLPVSASRSPLYQDTSCAGVGLTLMTSFELITSTVTQFPNKVTL